MTYIKLLKELGVELREARTMRKQKHYKTMRACLVHMMLLIQKQLNKYADKALKK